jgi:hypothetical protein
MKTYKYSSINSLPTNLKFKQYEFPQQLKKFKPINLNLQQVVPVPYYIPKKVEIK